MAYIILNNENIVKKHSIAGRCLSSVWVIVFNICDPNFREFILQELE